jgi:hypothetical protein
MTDDRNNPATKGDLVDLTTELKGDLADLRSELKGEIANQKDELLEAIRDSQTEVLKAFYGFGQTIQERFKQDDRNEAAMNARMTILESRVLDVEKRLNMPSSAA